MNNVLSYQQGDKVTYTGQKNRESLTREGKPLIGWIHSIVIGNPESYVVFFPETKRQDSYVMHHSVLAKARTPKTEGPDVAPRRRKQEDD